MSLRISKEYGVNPSITRCVCCGKDYDVALFGTSWKDKNGKTTEAPKEVMTGLCEQCNGVIEKGGAMIIEVRDGETGNNPFRTGRIVGISPDCKKRWNLTSPMNYMEESTFSKVFDGVEFTND